MTALADTASVAVACNRSPATIRSWAHRDLLKRHGTWRGKALYSLAEALEVRLRLDPGWEAGFAAGLAVERGVRA